MKKLISVAILLLTTTYTSNLICDPLATIIAPNGELIPAGISIPENLNNSHSSDYSKYATSLPNKFRTFDVIPNYEILPEGGVKFAIENVSPLYDDLHKPKITDKKYRVMAALETNVFYSSLINNKNIKDVYEKSDRKLLQNMEVFSKKPDNLVYIGSDGILAACVTAFAQHLMLQLSSDNFLMLILDVVCQHVNQNTEELRYKFVNHKGKKTIKINAPSLIKGNTPPDVWEDTIFSVFSKKIKDNLATKEIYDIITSKFSGTTPVQQSCKEIMFMGTTQKYFDFSCVTLCGIPHIKLLGTEQDWKSLIDRTEALLEYVTPEFKDFWLPKLKPVLEKFLDSYKGDIDYTFWQTMVKLRKTGNGSGSHSFISGWIQIFFPYLANNELNKNMKPWNESYFSGPKMSDFPNIMTSVPVLWEYLSSKFKMHYHAGIIGFSQSPDGSLAPAEGWRISYDNILVD
jgi:hypothetical protein